MRVESLVRNSYVTPKLELHRGVELLEREREIIVGEGEALPSPLAVCVCVVVV